MVATLSLPPLPPSLAALLGPHLAEQTGPGPGAFRTVTLEGLRTWADAENRPLRDVMLAGLAHDVWPLRFAKNRGWLAAPEQAILLRSRAFIAGCGGLGGHAALLLARAGVGAFTLCDPDTFSESNLNRQLACREDRIGMNKALAVALDIAATASHADVQSHDVLVTGGNAASLIGAADVALDCLDSIPARIILERAARGAGIPFIHAALAGQEGFTLIALPDQPPAMARLYPDAAQDMPDAGAEARLGVPAPTAAATAALQAAAACAALLGRGPGRGDARQFLFHLDLSVPELNRLSLDATSRADQP